MSSPGRGPGGDGHLPRPLTIIARMPGRTVRPRARAWSPRRLVPVVVAVVVVALLVVVVGGTLRSSPSHPPRPVAIASGSWPPFVGPDLPDDGPIARVITETLLSEGYAPTISFSSWPLALDQTRRAEVFGSFPFVGSDERHEDYYLSDPILEFEYVLFYSARRSPSPPPVETADDLRDMRVGRIAGYDVWTELDDAVDEFVMFESSIDAFRALDAGEIDLLPEGLLPGRAVIEGPDLRAGSADFGVLDGRGNPLLAATETLHFMMPRTPEAEQLMPRIDEALAAMKETDLFAQAVEELTSDTGAGQTVELVPVRDGGLVQLTDEAAGTTLLAPGGTEAMVLGWPDEFTEGTAAPPGATPVRVKILNGPAAGRVGTVDPRSIRLTAED